MAVHSSPARLLAAQTARAKSAMRSIAAQARHQAAEGYRDAVEAMSGRVPSEALRRAGHPYGRGPRPKANYESGGNALMRGRAPLLPLNVQSGRLRRSARVSQSGPAAFDLGIGGGVQYARYILHPAGTVKMVGRGLMGWRAVNASYPAGHLEKRHRLRTKAWRDALRQAHRRV